MSTWDWNDVANEEGPIEHPAAILARDLVPGKPPLGRDFDALFENRCGLPTLSIVEHSVSHEIRALFKVLRETGSQEGYVVEQVEEWKPASFCRRIRLDDETAVQIAGDAAMEPTMAFVDDTKRCALASWWSDHLWLALSPELFKLWLESEPRDFTLWGDEDPYPIPRDFETAKGLAERRRAAWERYSAR